MVEGKPSTRRGRRERRRSARVSVLQTIDWRIARGRRTYTGQVVERSLDGFAFLASAAEAPSPGARIRPVITRTGGRPLVIKSARVVRAVPAGAFFRLVSAEIEA